MKIDNHVKIYSLTPEQEFFVSCWHNMVHMYSLDSHRVRVMNSVNILRELTRMLTSKVANQNDKSIVAAEAYEIINSDPILNNHCFEYCKENFNSVYELKETKPKTSSNETPLVYKKENESSLIYYSSELEFKLKQYYVNLSFKRLKEILCTNPIEPTSSTPQKPFLSTLDELHKLTGNFLSYLLDSGYSLESLFQYYRQILVPVPSIKEQRKYNFERKISLVERLVNEESQEFIVMFLIRGISDSEKFPESIGDIKFLKVPPVLPENITRKQTGKKFANFSSKILCAEVTVNSNDVRTAGIHAYDFLNNVMDLVRFEYEREPLVIDGEFIAASKNAGAADLYYRIFTLPRNVPNPTSSIDAPQLRRFVHSVEQLVSNGKFSIQGRDRIHSAFRLYRTGLDTDNLDNKLVNWWTAIEYLVRDGEGGSIGKSVEDNIVPILCVGYIPKLLLTYRNALVDLNIEIRDPDNGNLILLKDLNLVNLYNLFKRSDIKTLLLSASEIDPFISYKLKSFLDALSDTNNIHSLHSEHEKRLRWHVQRLYRARCDIVHSAGRIVNAALLCANLEFYIKILLTKLLQELWSVPTLSTPHEFFDRQKRLYSQIQHELKQNNDRLLMRSLGNSIK